MGISAPFSGTIGTDRLRIVDPADPSKKAAFDASGITTGTTRVLAVQDKDGTIALLADVAGGIVLQGGWNAATNDPDLTTTPPPTGHAWYVTVEGATDLGGITEWKVGDLAVKTAAGWLRIHNQDTAAAWGNISGTLSAQTDLQNELDAKLDKDETGAETTGNVSQIQADSLTTGSIARFASNSSDGNARHLVKIINDNVAADGVFPLFIQQDAFVATNFKVILRAADVTFFVSDGTDPNGNLGGGAGDVCFNGVSGAFYICETGTTWRTPLNLSGAQSIDGLKTFLKNVTIGDGTAGSDYKLTFDGEDSDGDLQWLEDESTFRLTDGARILDIDLSSGTDLILKYNSANLVFQQAASCHVFFRGGSSASATFETTGVANNTFKWALSNGLMQIFFGSNVGTLDINQDKQDTNIQFRGATSNFLLFLDAGTNRIGILGPAPAAPLDIVLGETVDTNFTLRMKAGVKIYHSDGTTPVGNLTTGVATGDVCYNGPSGQPFYYNGAAWTGM